MNHQQDYDSAPVRQLRADLSLALRAAYHHGPSEGGLLYTSDASD